MTYKPINKIEQMKTKKLITTLILGLIFSYSYSQISASFYQNGSYSKIGLGYEFNDKLWTDIRLYTGSNIENITPEIVLNYNLVKKETYETYIGAGIVLNYFNGIVIPFGVGIKPFESLKNLSLNIEFNPFYEIDFDDIFIRGFIGIRYVLK